MTRGKKSKIFNFDNKKVRALMRHLTVIFVVVASTVLSIGIAPTTVMSDTKNKIVLFAEDVTKDDNHWRLVLTKNGNQVELETTLLRCNTCTITDVDVPLTMYCKSTTPDPESQFVSWCKDINFALRKMKGNLKKAVLWDAGSAGGPSLSLSVQTI